MELFNNIYEAYKIRQLKSTLNMIVTLRDKEPFLYQKLTC